MTTSPVVTARGLKIRLARTGFDYSALTFAERDETFRKVDFDSTGAWKRRTVVTVTGPKANRRRAALVLFDTGLGCAPFQDHDDWFP